MAGNYYSQGVVAQARGCGLPGMIGHITLSFRRRHWQKSSAATGARGADSSSISTFEFQNRILSALFQADKVSRSRFDATLTCASPKALPTNFDPGRSAGRRTCPPRSSLRFASFLVVSFTSDWRFSAGRVHAERSSRALLDKPAGGVSYAEIAMRPQRPRLAFPLMGRFSRLITILNPRALL